MGWCSGGELAGKIWALVAPHVEGEDAHEVALGICGEFESQDCDTLYEQTALYNAAYPWAVVDGDNDIAEQFATEEEAREELREYDAEDGMRVAHVDRLGVEPVDSEV